MESKTPSDQQFSGHIYIFHSFDIGDEINIEEIEKKQLLMVRPLQQAQYIKSYHRPLEVELPHPHETSHCQSVKLHNFGVVTLRYKIPFHSTLEKLRADIEELDNSYKEQAVSDARALYKQIKRSVRQPKFFHLNKSYTVIQVDTEKAIPVQIMKEKYANLIASLLRFETERLSDFKRSEIMKFSFGYYPNDLIVIDTESAFMYVQEYEDVLDMFEFVNMQHLELQYFDQVLDKKLNIAYETDVQTISWRSYIPMLGTLSDDPIVDLSKVKVDISVITERLENSVKLAGEPYYTELYQALNNKLDLSNWRDSISRKLGIITDISSVYESKSSAVREDLINLLIVILIFLELVLGLFHYLK